MEKITLFIICAVLLSAGMTFGQNVGIKSDGSAPDNSAMLDVKSTDKGMLVPRMTAAQRGAIGNPATGLMIYQTDAPSGYYYYNGTSWNLAGKSGQHFIGELFGGGVVFWVDNTGQHGLIVSMTDLSTTQKWSNIKASLIGQTAQSDWDGSNNSNAITGQSGHTSSSAKLCLDYTNADYGTGIFSDWYLPSRGEFNDLFNNNKTVQKALDTDGNPATIKLDWWYWSSTEAKADSAWTFIWNRGTVYSENKNIQHEVRAVRAF